MDSTGFIVRGPCRQGPGILRYNDFCNLNSAAQTLRSRNQLSVILFSIRNMELTRNMEKLRQLSYENWKVSVMPKPTTFTESARPLLKQMYFKLLKSIGVYYNLSVSYLRSNRSQRHRWWHHVPWSSLNHALVYTPARLV